MSPTPSFPAGYAARPARPDDAEDLAALFNASAVATGGVADTQGGSLAADWQQPDIDVETDTLLVTAPGGEPAAYATFWNPPPYVRPFLHAAVAPPHFGRGLGTAICAWGESRTAAEMARAGEGLRVALQQFIIGTNEPARALLAARGFALVRHNLRMVIDLDAPPPEPVLPPGIAIRSMARPQDDAALVRAQLDGFRDEWGFVPAPFDEELRSRQVFMDTDPTFDPDLVFLAVEGDTIAGTVSCTPQPSLGPEHGWIYALCVLRPWRRRGIARAMLLHSFAAFYGRGMRKVGLGVDATSITGATDLYEKAGMHVDRRYEFWEKEFRPGLELAARDPAA